MKCSTSDMKIKMVLLLAFTGLFLFGCINTTGEKSCTGTASPYCSGNIRYHDSYCSNGAWIYQNTVCPNGCNNGDCLSSVSCQGKDEDYCSGNVRYHDGVCNNGQWKYTTTTCQYGCSGGQCSSPNCPSSCDDGNPCTQDICSASTNYVCNYEPLTGTYGTCSGVKNCQQSSCVSGTCVQSAKSPCCGNSVCETGETYSTCSSDCVPKLNVIILGCTTGFDVSHGLGEVTNVYAEIQNIGNADASGVNAQASATDEAGTHPNKYASIGDLPTGTLTRVKMTVDTAQGVYGTITVKASSGNAGSTQKSVTDCSEIDEKTIQGIGQILKIAGGIPS